MVEQTLVFNGKLSLCLWIITRLVCFFLSKGRNVPYSLGTSLFPVLPKMSGLGCYWFSDSLGLVHPLFHLRVGKQSNLSTLPGGLWILCANVMSSVGLFCMEILLGFLHRGR